MVCKLRILIFQMGTGNNVCQHQFGSILKQTATLIDSNHVEIRIASFSDEDLLIDIAGCIVIDISNNGIASIFFFCRCLIIAGAVLF